MSCLPDEAVAMHGGCHCTAIRYTLSIPRVDERPVLVESLVEGEPDLLSPIFCLDHCNDCRKVSGAPVQFWNICSPQFISFSCLKRPENEGRRHATPFPPSDGDGERVTLTGDQILKPSDLTEKTYLTYYASSEDVWRTFCSQCGTNMSFVSVKDLAAFSTMDIPLGTLDREDLERARPTRHVHWNRGIDWVRNLTSEGEKVFAEKGLPKHPGGNPQMVVES
ncbi:hypothetical protein AJ80_08041 [Polytolypa hystricis UAMH7299]|uniref:Uncharacterized protein n=1 Tax=Polytolypa hystricis (strain UAMH7299) TaxID=1447883 RepID=A0A2B7XE83_POLH7|nr:hypothetical protein AJ80_08041 [Polytolypa hystricis UAMH7299]